MTEAKQEQKTKTKKRRRCRRRRWRRCRKKWWRRRRRRRPTTMWIIWKLKLRRNKTSLSKLQYSFIKLMLQYIPCQQTLFKAAGLCLSSSDPWHVQYGRPYQSLGNCHHSSWDTPSILPRWSHRTETAHKTQDRGNTLDRTEQNIRHRTEAAHLTGHRQHTRTLCTHVQLRSSSQHTRHMMRGLISSMVNHSTYSDQLQLFNVGWQASAWARCAAHFFVT